MSALIPDSLDPWSAVRDGRVLAGELDVGRLPRLAAETRSIGPGGFELRFGRDEEGRAVVVGRVRASLRLICQRCIGEMDLPVDAEIAWGLLHSDAEATGLAEHLDPVVVGDSPIDFWTLLEDELLLAMPQVPMHPVDDCQVAGSAASQSEPDSQSQDVSEAENPFAVLAALKTRHSEEGSGDN